MHKVYDMFKRQHDEMLRLGYLEITPVELGAFVVLGKDVYCKVVDTVFEYSCLESDYLELRKGKEFKVRCKSNLESALKAFVSEIRTRQRNGEIEVVDFQPASRKEMLRNIMKGNKDGS